MVYTRLISGLGNQLFQYAVGRQVALLHNAPLKLDITFFASQSLRSYKLDAYNIRAEIATEAEISAVLAVYAST
ncbi:MAG: alpha-1,2-fucosyltransferase, partial [Hymenobacter sp.]